VASRYAVDADIARGVDAPRRVLPRRPTPGTRRASACSRGAGSGSATSADVAAPATLSPRTLLPGLLDEPLLLARDAARELRCLSNVCTHRGNLLVREACVADQIRCGYHSRRFDLAGRMTFMPEFAGAEHFPSPADDLPRVALGEWAGLAFAVARRGRAVRRVQRRSRRGPRAMPLDRLAHDPSRDRDYDVAAHWALYVENYLEGFHIPFVHGALNDASTTAAIRRPCTRFPACRSRSRATARRRSRPRRPGADSVAAYYWWVFPNLMVNAYPWGLSINHVRPIAPDRTRVAFRSYVWDRSRLDRGAGGALDRVEREDEAIVEAVQRACARGSIARAAIRRRARPASTTSHRLLCAFLATPPGEALR
jgi:choline monooxygenase